MKRDVLTARNVLGTMVIRPALVYGREQAIWSSLFSLNVQAMQNSKKVVQISLDTNSRPALVHVNDVALGPHYAVENRSI